MNDPSLSSWGFYARGGRKKDKDTVSSSDRIGGLRVVRDTFSDRVVKKGLEHNLTDAWMKWEGRQCGYLGGSACQPGKQEQMPWGKVFWVQLRKPGEMNVAGAEAWMRR